MSVVVSNKEVGPHRRQLQVEVPAAAVEAETRRVVDEYRRQARLPGFRKGKVPHELVRQRYEREIDRAVVERLVPRYWRQAEAEAELDVLLQPEIEVDRHGSSELSFTATVEVRPRIEIGDLDGIELPDPGIEPDGAEVDDAIEELRRQAADWVPAERAAAHGDRVQGRLTTVGEEDGGSGEQQVDFEVGDPQVWEELTLAAVGAQTGGAVDFTRRPAPDAEERRFHLEIEAVLERQLAELDDELAGRLGNFADVAALREAVTGQLRDGKRRERLRARERALLDELRRRHPLALPEGLVRHEVEAMLRAYADEMARRGIDLERAEIDWQALAERERPQAEKRVHARLVLDAAADKEAVEVGEAEFEQLLARLARSEGRSAGALRKALDGSGRLEELRARMRREKLILRLLGEEQTEPPAGAVDNE